MLALCLTLAQASAPQDAVVPRGAKSWRASFDAAWILPANLPLAEEPRQLEAVDLGARMRELLALRWEAPDGAARSLGDVVSSAWLAGETAQARWSGVREQLAGAPPAARSAEPWLRELVADDALFAAQWNPERDDARDGIAFARPLTLERRLDAPWSRIEGSRLVQQACVVVRADLNTIKSAENDYRRYPLRAGARYESIHPVRDSYWRGVDEERREFAVLRIQFRCDLPFPFDDYRCDLSILNRVEEDGTLRCDIVSRSRDFLWLAGNDLYLPVETGGGELVATCIVRRFGFDLRGVPDGDDARRTGLRSSLGSLKLEAEALARARGGALRSSDGRLPPFDVRGARPAR